MVSIYLAEQILHIQMIICDGFGAEGSDQIQFFFYNIATWGRIEKNCCYPYQPIREQYSYLQVWMMLFDWWNWFPTVFYSFPIRPLIFDILKVRYAVARIKRLESSSLSAEGGNSVPINSARKHFYKDLW